MVSGRRARTICSVCCINRGKKNRFTLDKPHDQPPWRNTHYKVLVCVSPDSSMQQRDGESWGRGGGGVGKRGEAGWSLLCCDFYRGGETV